LDVALIQSLVRKGVVDDRVANYGHVIVDECHHISARSFELVVRRAKAKFITGLSATVARKDGHHPIIFMQCGPVRHRVDAKSQAAARPFTHHVIVRPTNFRAIAPPPPDARMEFHELYEALRKEDGRNAMICEDVLNAINQGRSPFVLTERTEHLLHLTERLAPHVPNLVLLRGGQSRKVMEAATARLAEMPETGGRVILAIGKYIGEGFDDPRLDTLFLTLRVSWRGTIGQYVGRLHRLHDGKRDVRVYDYADLNVPMLSRMFDKRCSGYESLGYTILLPAALFLAGPPKFRFRLIRNGNATTPPAFAASYEMAWTSRSRICSCMQPGHPALTPKEKTAPEAPVKPFYFDVCKHSLKRLAVFV
jgi:superfamily II DNA or RNA helicase